MKRTTRLSTLMFWLACSALAVTGCVTAYDPEGEEFVSGCDPAATEVCNGRDDNCDGQVDEGCDGDGDGYCAASMEVSSGATCQPGDCDDTNPAVNPGALERCSGVDENCNGQVDEGCDDDGDGFCDASMEVVLSPTGELPAVCSMGPADCDDTDASLTSPVWYRDADGDGAGDPSQVEETCTPPAGYVTRGDDCDDTDPERSPSAAEVCDGKDNDCNGEVDDDATDGTTYYVDADGDGFGDPQSEVVVSCAAPSGYVANADDCDDTSASTYPGAPELCDDILNDCAAASADLGCNDDGDAYCDASMTTVGTPAVCPGGGGDCNDDNGDIYPGATEICSPIDMDCDGQPGVLSLSAAVLSPPQPGGSGEDMAFNGTNLGVAWVDTGELSAEAWFAEIRPSDLAVVRTVELQTGGRAVWDVAVAWEPTTSSWGIGYVARDADDGWIVGLQHVNASGVVVADVILDRGVALSTVKVVGGNGYLGVLYTRLKPGSGHDVWYTPYDVASTAARTPVLVAQNRSVLEGSYAVQQGGGTTAVYMAFNRSATQYSGGAFRIQDGGNYLTLTDRSRPTALDTTTPTLHATSNGKLFLVYGAPPAVNGNPNRVVAQELNTSMGNVGGLIDLGTDLSPTWPQRGLLFDGNEYVAFGRSASNTSVMRFKRFSSSWSVLNSVETTFTGISPGDGQVLAMATTGTQHFVLNPSPPSGESRFFRIHRVADTGTSPYTRDPISTPTVVSPINQSERAFFYDAAASDFLVVQEDPAQPDLVEVLRVASDGTIGPATDIGTYPTGCPNYISGLFKWDDRVACLANTWDAATCMQTQTVHVIDVVNARWEEVHHSSWTSSSCTQENQVAQPIGFGERLATIWFDNPGQKLVLRIAGPDGTATPSTLVDFGNSSPGCSDAWLSRSQLVEDERGNVVLVYQGSTAEYCMGYSQTMFVAATVIGADGTTGPTHVIHTLHDPNFGGGTFNFSAFPYTDKVGIVVYTSHYDGTSDSSELRFFSFDAQSGDLNGPTSIASATSSTTYIDIHYLEPATAVGGRVLVPYTLYSYSSNEYEVIFAQLREDGTTTQQSLAQQRDYTYAPRATGDAGYFAVAYQGAGVLKMRVFDDNDVLIASAQLPYTSTSTATIEQFHYTGSDFVGLVNGDSRLIMFSGTCGGQ